MRDIVLTYYRALTSLNASHFVLTGLRWGLGLYEYWGAFFVLGIEGCQFADEIVVR